MAPNGSSGRRQPANLGTDGGAVPQRVRQRTGITLNFHRGAGTMDSHSHAEIAWIRGSAVVSETAGFRFESGGRLRETHITRPQMQPAGKLLLAGCGHSRQPYANAPGLPQQSLLRMGCQSLRPRQDVGVGAASGRRYGAVYTGGSMMPRQDHLAHVVHSDSGDENAGGHLINRFHNSLAPTSEGAEVLPHRSRQMLRPRAALTNNGGGQGPGLLPALTSFASIVI